MQPVLEDAVKSPRWISLVQDTLEITEHAGYSGPPRKTTTHIDAQRVSRALHSDQRLAVHQLEDLFENNHERLCR